MKEAEKRRPTGRSKSPTEELVSVVRLPRKYLDTIDEIIRSKNHSETINYSAERRTVLCAIIESWKKNTGHQPTAIRPSVPPGRYSDADQATIAEWIKQETRRLTRTAPVPILIQLEINTLKQLKHNSTPDEYLKTLRQIVDSSDNQPPKPPDPNAGKRKKRRKQAKP